MAYRTKDLLDALDYEGNRQYAEEIEKRLYAFRALRNSCETLVHKLDHFEDHSIMVDSRLLTPLSEIISLVDEVDCDV